MSLSKLYYFDKTNTSYTVPAPFSATVFPASYLVIDYTGPAQLNNATDLRNLVIQGKGSVVITEQYNNYAWPSPADLALIPITVPVTATYVVSDSDKQILVDTTVTTALTLPTKGMKNGRQLIITDNGNAHTANLVITPEGSEKISGAASLTFDTNYQSVVIEADGNNWFVVSKK